MPPPIDLAGLDTEPIYFVQLPDVVVGDRYRTKVGDIDRLVLSIFGNDGGDPKKGIPAVDGIGLLNPITVTDPTQPFSDGQMRLVAGWRRLEAYRRTGRSVIAVRLCPDLDTAVKILRAELEENESGCREAMSDSDRGRLILALEAGEKAEAEARQKKTRAKPGEEVGKVKHRARVTGGATVSPPVKQANSANSTNPTDKGAKKGKTRELLGKAADVSGPTAERLMEVMKAAKDDPKRFGDLPELLDAKGPKAAYEELKRRQADEMPAGQGGGRDGAGLPIPDQLRATFSQVSSLYTIARSQALMLSRTMNQIAQLPGGSYLAAEMSCRGSDEETKFVCESLAACRAKLAATEPYCSACPYCEAKHAGKVDRNCTACKGRGWGPKSLWERAPESERELTRRRRGGAA